jgi:hypothetical protein
MDPMQMWSMNLDPSSLDGQLQQGNIFMGATTPQGNNMM